MGNGKTLPQWGGGGGGVGDAEAASEAETAKHPDVTEIIPMQNLLNVLW